MESRYFCILRSVETEEGKVKRRGSSFEALDMEGLFMWKSARQSNSMRESRDVYIVENLTLDEVRDLKISLYDNLETKLESLNRKSTQEYLETLPVGGNQSLPAALLLVPSKANPSNLISKEQSKLEDSLIENLMTISDEFNEIVSEKFTKFTV